MSDESSAIRLVEKWQAGDQQAAADLFVRYANRLIALAYTRLSEKLSNRVDPEDVVQSAYRSFFVGAREGRYDLQRGSDLWSLLVSITLNKLHHQVRRNTAGKRSVDRETSLGDQEQLNGIPTSALRQEPSPVEAVALADELESLMRGLEPLARKILELRLQGQALEEIAATLNCCERTVRRVLSRIKQQIEQENQASGD
jgi:RNA polymerase sigma factor (sigma-70 family)